eukprot:644208_1
MASSSGGRYFLAVACGEFNWEGLSEDAKEEYVVADFCYHGGLQELGRAMFVKWPVHGSSPSKKYIQFLKDGQTGTRLFNNESLKRHVISLLTLDDKATGMKYIMGTLGEDDEEEERIPNEGDEYNGFGGDEYNGFGGDESFAEMNNQNDAATPEMSSYVGTPEMDSSMATPEMGSYAGYHNHNSNNKSYQPY